VEFHNFPLSPRPAGRSSFGGLHRNPPIIIHRATDTPYAMG
jgi:hypothetical protein